jgi:hypothetical protein
VTSRAPFRPLSQVILSHPTRKHSSGHVATRGACEFAAIASPDPIAMAIPGMAYLDLIALSFFSFAAKGRHVWRRQQANSQGNPFEFDTNIGTVRGKNRKPLFIHCVTILKHRVLRENISDDRHFVSERLPSGTVNSPPINAGETCSRVRSVSDLQNMHAISLLPAGTHRSVLDFTKQKSVFACPRFAAFVLIILFGNKRSNLSESEATGKVACRSEKTHGMVFQRSRWAQNWAQLNNEPLQHRERDVS